MQRIKRDDKEVKSRKLCCVPQCTTYCNSTTSLHKFPLDPKAAKNWKTILKLGKPISKYMLVCSKHFVKDDFFIVTSSTKKRRLKKGSFPSQNLPVCSHDHSTIKKDRSDRSWLKSNENGENEEQLEQEENQNEQIESELSRKQDERHTLCLQDNEHDYVMNPGESSTVNANTSYHTALTHVFNDDKSTNTDFCDFFEISQFLTDEKLSHFTGVSNNIIKIYTTCTMELARHNNVSEKNMNMWVVLVLCKLKTNLSFACLAVLFRISNSTCTRMFYSTLSLLAISIRPAIYWPTKEEIKKNMPKCFALFRDTRVVLDCTEVKVQSLKCLKCRILSYSHYKKMHTMKFLIGTTPSGLISFMSRAYGGRASDKSIFNNENLISKLDPYDAIMVDKGVLIEKECQSHFVKLIQPPFLRKKKQLSKEESTSTAEIARARVHVERAIQRIKNFAILNDEIDWYLIPYIDDIMTVIAVSVNMSRPILADTKF